MTNQPYEALELLSKVGLDAGQVNSFFSRVAIVYLLPTQTKPGIGLIQLIDATRLRHGIVEIDDVGGGLRSFGQFRARTMALARLLGLVEVELFAAAVINPRLERLLIRQGFIRGEEPVHEELGDDGTMETHSKWIRVVRGG